MTAQPSSPSGVTIGSGGLVQGRRVPGPVRSPEIVDATASGDAERSGVIEMARTPTSSRPSVAVVTIRTLPPVVVGSCSGGPSSDGCRHERS